MANWALQHMTIEQKEPQVGPVILSTSPPFESMMVNEGEMQLQSCLIRPITSPVVLSVTLTSWRNQRSKKMLKNTANNGLPYTSIASRSEITHATATFPFQIQNWAAVGIVDVE